MQHSNVTLAIGLLLTCLVLVVIQKFRQWYHHRHNRNIRQAKRTLKKLNALAHAGAKFTYLRKIDPFVFEELLLCAFQNQGHRVIRNKRYTGDGGIDGKVILNGTLHLVQAKRYQHHINAQHVADFSTLCQQMHCKGLFIHTGKTGKLAYQQTHGIVTIISGDQLLQLIGG